jgi:hypothetical protein
MSIAVSTAVYPSRILFALSAGMCASLILVAMLIGFDGVGDLDFFARAGLASVCCCFAFFAYSRALAQSRTACWIQISGSGQIRVSRTQKIDKTNAAAWMMRAAGEGELLRLLPTSTLWTSMMILHFRHADKHTSRIVVLPDALSDHDSKAGRHASYSALLVACRWALLHQTAEYAQQEKCL